MIQSMTGYGKAEINLVNRSFAIEIKSLNSKQIDTHIKMSSIYKDKEIGLEYYLVRNQHVSFILHLHTSPKNPD